MLFCYRIKREGLRKVLEIEMAYGEGEKAGVSLRETGNVSHRLHRFTQKGMLRCAKLKGPPYRSQSVQWNTKYISAGLPVWPPEAA
jgi:hypothetical protein